MSIGSIKDYILTSNYEIKPFQEEKVEGQPLAYQYNALERVGNALLSPMRWAISNYDATDSTARKVGLVALEILVSGIALVGLSLKRFGEIFNDTKVRDTALKTFKEISEHFDRTGHTLKNPYEVFKKLGDLKIAEAREGQAKIHDAFNKYIQSKFKATEEEMRVLQKESDPKPEMCSDPRFSRMSLFKVQSDSILEKMMANILAGSPVETQKRSISRIFENHQPVIQEVDSVLNRKNLISEISQHIKNTVEQYHNAIGYASPAA